VGTDGRGYVLADASGRYTPDGWARAAVGLYRSLNADRIVAESNFGGQMVEATIRAVDGNLPVKMVHASRGKVVRAEPIVALYEQRRISHVGLLPGLEDQLCGWDPTVSGPSPDRLDALVWALTDLMGERQAEPPRCIHMNWMGR
jgi:phage terminase large subunit-like protein